MRFAAALYNLSLWVCGLIVLQQVRYLINRNDARRRALLAAGFWAFLLLAMVAADQQQDRDADRPRLGEDVGAPRISDLGAVIASTVGKVELESVGDESPEERIVERLRQAMGRGSSHAIARLRDGVSLEQARADMQAIMAQLRTEAPQRNTNWSVTLVPIYEQTVDQVRPALYLLSGAVLLVLFRILWLPGESCAWRRWSRGACSVWASGYV